MGPGNTFCGLKGCNMTCRRVRSRLSEYIDGEMPPWEKAQVREHLLGCARCAAEVSTLRRTVRLARQAGVYAPPPDLRARLEVAVLANLARAPVPVPWPRRLLPYFTPVAALAGAVAVCLLVVCVGGLATRSREPAPSHVAQATHHPAVAPPTVHVPAEPISVAHPYARTPLASSSKTAGGTSTLKPAVPSTEKEGPVASAPSRTRPLRDSQRATKGHGPSTQAKRAVATRRPAPGVTAVPGTKQVPRQPKTADPLAVAESLYSSGRYTEAVGVLNAAFAQACERSPEEIRERNALADSAILECSRALRQDPGNVNARKYLGEAYSAKVALLQSLAG